MKYFLNLVTIYKIETIKTNKMLYTAKVNLYAIQKHNYPLTSEDAVILNVFYHAFNEPNLSKIYLNSTAYTWVSHGLLREQIPNLGKFDKNGNFKPYGRTTLHTKITRLVDLGFLKRHPDSQLLKKPFYTRTSKLQTLFLSKEMTNYPENGTSVPKTEQVFQKQNTECSKNRTLNVQKMEHYNNTNYNNTKDNIDKGAKAPPKPILYQSEFKEIFNIISKESGLQFRIKWDKLDRSNKYKDFLRFWKKHKNDYSFDEVKKVIQYTCRKNFLSNNNNFSNFTTLFRSANFERSYDFWLSDKNRLNLNDNKPSGTNTPEKKESLTQTDLDNYNRVLQFLNDSRFTKNIFFAVLGGEKYDRLRSRFTPREIAKKIQKGLDESLQAYNKNKSLTELIFLNLK